MTFEVTERPTLGSALARGERVRFLCSGNMVRSALAELYARHRECPLPVDSAATRFQNEALFPETYLALERLGVPGEWLDSFRPRRIDEIDERPGDGIVLLGMTRVHLAAWRAHRPRHRATFLLSELEGTREDIADPVLEGASFGATFEQVARCVDALIALLHPGS